MLYINMYMHIYVRMYLHKNTYASLYNNQLTYISSKTVSDFSNYNFLY